MTVRIINSDVLEGLRTMEDESIHCVVTSPPYYALRDYGTGEWTGGDPDCKHQMMPLFSDKSTIKSKNHKAKDQGIPYKGHKCGKCGATRIDQQIGLEQTPQEYIERMVDVCREIRRVLRHDGTFWLNIGDSYCSSTFLGNNQGSSGGLGNSQEYKEALHRKGSSRPLPMGLKQKDMMGIPWRLAIALQADGWYLRQDIIWHKPNPMPESVTDRCTKAHEYIFLLTKSAQYYYDAVAIREPLKPGEYQAGLKQAMKAGYDGKSDYADWYFNKRNGKDWVAKAQQDEIGGPGSRIRTGFGQGKKMNPNGPPPTLMHPSGGANKRDVWSITVKAFKESHFATFPPELPMYCIKAGTSEKGACGNCGAPFERLQSRIGPDGTEVITKASAHSTKKPDGTALMGNNNEHSDTPLKRTGAGGIAKKGVVQKETVGWVPTCACGVPEIVPCVVYDPFGGSGTTAMVANRLGRDAIITELNPEYVEIAKERIRSTDPLFVEVEIDKPASLEDFIA